MFVLIGSIYQEVFTVLHIFHVESNWTLLGPQTVLGLVLSEITAKMDSLSPSSVPGQSAESMNSPRIPHGLN